MAEQQHEPPEREPIAVDPGRILDALAAGVLLSDAEGHILWANPAACELLLTPADALLGQARSALPARRRLRLSRSAERLRVCDGHGAERWLDCVTEAFTGSPPAAQLTTIVDVTQVERRRARRSSPAEPADPTQLDPATGLLNRGAIQMALAGEVARSRRYHNPLSLLLLAVALSRPTPGARVARIDALQAERGVARLLRDKLRWVDMVGAWQRGRILIVLPETPGEAAAQLARKIRAQVRGAGRSLPVGNEQLRIAMTEWARGDDAAGLVRRLEADHDGGAASPAGGVSLV